MRETWCHKYDDNGCVVYNADRNLDPTCCWLAHKQAWLYDMGMSNAHNTILAHRADLVRETLAARRNGRSDAESEAREEGRTE